MGIFDYLKNLNAKPEMTEEELDAIRTETENKIRNATKKQLKDFEDRIYFKFSEVEVFANEKMEQVKMQMVSDPSIKPEHIANAESEIDEYLKKATNELEMQVEEIINDTIKVLKFDQNLIKKRFENTKTIIKATAGMGMRKNREFFDAVRVVLEKNKNV